MTTREQAHADLKAARALIEDPARWTQGTSARDGAAGVNDDLGHTATLAMRPEEAAALAHRDEAPKGWPLPPAPTGW